MADPAALGLAPDAGDELATMLADSARSFLAARHSPARMRAMRDDRAGLDRAVWREMAELGWFALCVPEEQGGAGLSPSYATFLARVLGGALLSEPFVQCGLLPAALLSALADGGAAPLLADLLAGERIVTLAWQERVGEIDADGGTTLIVRDGECLRVTGTKRFVPWAAAADRLIVCGRLDDELALVLVDAAEAMVEDVPLIDGAKGGTVALNDATAILLGTGVEVDNALAAALGIARAAIAAELVGLSSSALGLTAEFLRTRVQFGKPIGAFQALQHRLVDYYNQVRLADAAVSAAARALANGGGADAAVSGAKARASEVAETVTAGAIQLHGAIGYTDEHDIGLFLKGALRRASAFGNAKAHRARALAALRPAERAV